MNEGLHDLSRAIDLAAGKVPGDLLARAAALRDTIIERQAAGLETTVAALFGATGSGKSSLFNALAGEQLARVAARRPTTSAPMAVSQQPASDVLDWLEVNDRHLKSGMFSTHGDRIVLLDMPDIDSTEIENREIAQRLASVVDVLIWVLDPQKYADAVVHEDYLRAMSEHSDVTLIVLNQIDTIDEVERMSVRKDAERIIREDGLDADVIPTSARTGEGISDLKARIVSVAATQEAAYERMTADVRSVGNDLKSNLGEPGKGVTTKDREAIVSAVASAAGVDHVAKAAAGSYRYRGRTWVGWPPLAWLRSIRVDPLKGLHLLPEKGEVPALTGVRATPAKESQVQGLVRGIVTDATEGMPPARRRDAAESAEYRVGNVLDHADRIIARADLGYSERPGWWSVWRLLQWVFLLIAAAGAIWIGVLWAFESLAMPLPDTPQFGEFPVPPVLFLGGLLMGLILTILGRAFLTSGANAVERRVRKTLTKEITPVTEEHMLAGIDRVIEESEELNEIAERLMHVGRSSKKKRRA
nr:YfjP family GTPase [Flaviflexus huanghaiensis]